MGTQTTGRLALRWAAGRAGLAVLLAVGLAGPAGGALAPNYQRAREVGAVAEAVAATTPDPIERIERVGVDRYEVTVGVCVIVAILRTRTDLAGPPVVGPRRFEVLLEPPRC